MTEEEVKDASSIEETWKSAGFQFPFPVTYAKHLCLEHKCDLEAFQTELAKHMVQAKMDPKATFESKQVAPAVLSFLCKVFVTAICGEGRFRIFLHQAKTIKPPPTFRSVDAPKCLDAKDPRCDEFLTYLYFCGLQRPSRFENIEPVWCSEMNPSGWPSMGSRPNTLGLSGVSQSYCVATITYVSPRTLEEELLNAKALQNECRAAVRAAEEYCKNRSLPIKLLYVFYSVVDLLDGRVMGWAQVSPVNPNDD